jgi:hypothetical protein
LLRPPNWNRYVSSIPTSEVSSSCSRWAASSGDSDRFIVPPGNDYRDLTRATRSTWPSRLHMIVALSFMFSPTGHAAAVFSEQIKDHAWAAV